MAFRGLITTLFLPAARSAINPPHPLRTHSTAMLRRNIRRLQTFECRVRRRNSCPGLSFGYRFASVLLVDESGWHDPHKAVHVRTVVVESEMPVFIDLAVSLAISGEKLHCASVVLRSRSRITIDSSVNILSTMRDFRHTHGEQSAIAHIRKKLPYIIDYTGVAFFLCGPCRT